MGMSEKEISKFLASKALNDAKLVRELEVAPKKTIPYRNTCHLSGHSKNQCNQMQIRMKQSKKTEKAMKHHNVIEPTIEMIQMELQNNVSDLRASENFLCETGKALGKHVIRSKRLIEVQRKLFDHLFELQLKRVNGLKNLRFTLSKAKNPKKVLKKLPLQAEELEQFKRILSGEEELKKLDDRFTDYLIYLEQIKERRLELHRQHDYTDYTKLKYIAPDGVVHKQPLADAKPETRHYQKVIRKRISAPRTVNLKYRNTLKRIRHAELIRKSMQGQKPGGKHIDHRRKFDQVALHTTSPRLERLRRQVLDLQARYHSAQKKVNQLTRELQLRINKPEYRRRCQEIRKELCQKVDEAVWKQKDYERENTRLKKMENRRTFTRIERAFTATTVFGDTSVGSNANDVTDSVDQSF